MTNAELVKEIKHIAGVTGGWDDNYDFEYPPNAPDDDADEIFVLVEDGDWTQVSRPHSNLVLSSTRRSFHGIRISFRFISY